MSDEFNYEAFIPSRSKSPELIKRPKRGNFILRQELNAYNPECSPKCGIIFNTFLLVITFSLGIPIIFLSRNTVEFTIPYTDCSKTENGVYKNSLSNNNFCVLNLNINVTMPSPIYFYYELDNFYLNHRDIVKSKSYSQLLGQVNIVY